MEPANGPFSPVPHPSTELQPYRWERSTYLLFIWFGMQENLFLSVTKYCYCLSGKFASLCEKVLPVYVRTTCFSLCGSVAWVCQEDCFSLWGSIVCCCFCQDYFLFSVRKYCLCLSGRLASLCEEVLCVCQENLLFSVRKHCVFVRKTCFSVWGSIASVCQETLPLSVRKYCLLLCMSGILASLCEEVMPVSVRKTCFSPWGSIARLSVKLASLCEEVLPVCLWGKLASLCEEVLSVFVRKTCFSVWGSIAIVCQENLLLSVRKYCLMPVSSGKPTSLFEEVLPESVRKTCLSLCEEKSAYLCEEVLPAAVSVRTICFFLWGSIAWFCQDDLLLSVRTSY